MRIIIFCFLALSFTTACKRGKRNLEIAEVSPVDIPPSGGSDDSTPFEWDGLSDLALGGLQITKK